VERRVTEAKKRWKRSLGKRKEDERSHGIKREKGHGKHRKKVVLGEEQHARGEFDAISYG